MARRRRWQKPRNVIERESFKQAKKIRKGKRVVPAEATSAIVPTAALQTPAAVRRPGEELFAGYNPFGIGKTPAVAPQAVSNVTSGISSNRMPKNPFTAMAVGWKKGIQPGLDPKALARGIQQPTTRKGIGGALTALGQWAMGGTKYKSVEELADMPNIMKTLQPLEQTLMPKSVYEKMVVGASKEGRRASVERAYRGMVGGSPKYDAFKKMAMRRSMGGTALRGGFIAGAVAGTSALLPGGFMETAGMLGGASAGYAFGTMAFKGGAGFGMRRGLLGLGKQRMRPRVGAGIRGGIFAAVGAVAGSTLFGGSQGIVRQGMGKLTKTLTTPYRERLKTSMTPTYSLEQGGYPGAPVFGQYGRGMGRI